MVFVTKIKIDWIIFVKNVKKPLNQPKNLGNKLNKPDTTPKNYWKIIHRVMNKSRAPKIPPILSNGKFVLSCADKANLFNEFFSNQCTLILNSSTIPDFSHR